MILSAHRVRAHNGAEGINCYHYAHGEGVAVTPDQLFYLPGVLVWQHRPLPLPGNRVRSFVDVAAPDSASWESIFGALDVLLSHAPMPQAFSPADSVVAFRLDMDASLRPHWQQEVLYLLSHLHGVHP